MHAKDVMSSEVISVGDTARVRDAIALFQESALHGYPVIDADGKPLGIVTASSILRHAVPLYASSDLLAVMKGGPDIESIYKNLEGIINDPVTDVMDENFQIMKVDTPTSAIAAMFISLQGDSSNLMVVDHNGRLVGIISARDLICRLPEQATV